MSIPVSCFSFSGSGVGKRPPRGQLLSPGHANCFVDKAFNSRSAIIMDIRTLNKPKSIMPRYLQIYLRSFRILPNIEPHVMLNRSTCDQQRRECQNFETKRWHGIDSELHQ